LTIADKQVDDFVVEELPQLIGLVLWGECDEGVVVLIGSLILHDINYFGWFEA